jgi:outer membrane protein assembly factor BamE (lipoprotein component of BamABCDE complex)
MKTIPALLLLAAVSLGGCATIPAPETERSDKAFTRIELGMTQPEVRRLLGKPDGTMPFSRSSTLAWDYEYQDTWGYFAVFSVTFDSGGRAVGKIAWRINDGGDHQ